MARVKVTTAWTDLGDAKTDTYVQNVGDDLIRVALRSDGEPAAGADEGFVVHRGGFVNVKGDAADNAYARALSGESELEIKVA